MQFKHPEFLYALFALLIPIIVHLFQLRKFQKEAFTNVALLKKVSLQTRKSSVIKKWLTLLTRLLLFTAIILAFAQPYTSKKSSLNTKTETVIYLDNSFSLQAKGAQGELFKRAIQDLITEIPEDETISILTNNDLYKNTSVKAIKNDLLQLDYASNQLHYDAVLLKSKTLFSKDVNSIKKLILLSDFQQNKNNFVPKQDSLIQIHAVQLKPVNSNNISIDSIYISKNTATTSNLEVILKNSGVPVDNVPISLLNNGNLIAKTAVAVDKETSATFTIPQNEIIQGEITIDEPFLQFDNSLYFNLNQSDKVNVLSINANNDSYLKRIYNETEFNYNSTTINLLNYSIINDQNLIILNGLDEIPNALITAINAFVNSGGYLTVIPSESVNIQSYKSLLTSSRLAYNTLNATEKRVTNINYSHSIYNNVFDKRVDNFQYPKVNSYYAFQYEEGTKVLAFEDGKPFLMNQKNTFVFSAALTQKNSNFKDSPLIVPTLYNIAKRSLKIPNLYYNIGEQNQFDVSTTLQQDDILTLSNGDLNLIPQQQYFNNKVAITTQETPNKAGIYTIKNKSISIESVSYNYNRSESDLKYQDMSAQNTITTSDSIAQLFDTLKSESKINELWKWFVIFALAFLVIEMLILKYFK